jgi:hypothetical protein
MDLKKVTKKNLTYQKASQAEYKIGKDYFLKTKTEVTPASKRTFAGAASADIVG